MKCPRGAIGHLAAGRAASENERGFWLPELRYVTDLPAKQEYPSTKGYAPSSTLEPSYTRDLGHTGWMLQRFHDAQPEKGSGPGQIPEQLSLAETAVLPLTR